MIRSADLGPCVDLHHYLSAFCALAMELYPDEDWAAVEPKLHRSWQRYLGDSMCSWEQVRDSAQARWEARHLLPARAWEHGDRAPLTLPA